MVNKNSEFASIYDGMNALYSKIEDLMGSAYNRVKSDPNDIEARAMLDELNDIAQTTLYIQMGFVENYCDKRVINVLIGEIKDKVESLSDIKVKKVK